MKKIILLAVVIGFSAAMTASAADAKTTWEKDCAMCHGKDGKGDTKIGQKLGIKDFTDAKVQAEIKDDAAKKAIKEGIKDSEGRLKMKAFPNLSDDDVKGLLEYVRSFKK